MKKYLIFSNWKLVYLIAGFIFQYVHPFEPLSQPPLCYPVLATLPLRDALAFLICIFLFLCPVKWVTWLMFDWYVCLPALPVKSEVAPFFVCIPTVLGDKQREEVCLVPELLLVLPWRLRRHPSAACPISLTDVSTPLAELVGQDVCPHLGLHLTSSLHWNSGWQQLEEAGVGRNVPGCHWDSCLFTCEHHPRRASLRCHTRGGPCWQILREPASAPGRWLQG